MDLLHSVTTYGLWLVINPVSQTLLNIKCQRISVDPESGMISIRGNDSDPSRTLFLKDHGKTWFRTRKEAIRYFKDHIRAFCNLKRYEWSDSEDAGRWFLRIDHYIKVFNSAQRKNWYIMVDNITGVQCDCAASEWGIMCDVIEHQMTEHLAKKNLDK